MKALTACESKLKKTRESAGCQNQIKPCKDSKVWTEYIQKLTQFAKEDVQKYVKCETPYGKILSEDFLIF